MDDKERIRILEEALKPFAAIADEYDHDGLDEARPYWINKGIKKFDLSVELYSGRGGKELMTLGDVIRAREALTGIQYKTPVVDAFVQKVRQHYEAGLPNLQWDQMSEDRRTQIIENFRKLGVEGE